MDSRVSEKASQLLRTKTRLPPLPADWLPRQRLSDRLNQALRHKLALLSAPAGYGKTSLAVEALRASQTLVAWVSLDATDNLLGVFLSYLISALQGLIPGIGQPILNALQSSQPPPTDLLLNALVNSISESSSDLVVVLDDYHVVDSEANHDAVRFLVERMPPNAHLVIIGRSDPPLPLARWRVKGDLAEIRAEDLSFTTEEAAAYFCQAGIALSEHDLATLETRTEGWIAGLKMAALSLEGKKDVSRIVDAFSGAHHFVLDYLAEEVLNQQSPGVRQFLLETSVLDRLSGPLCDAVTGRSDGQTMLLHLEQANLFVTRLDDERRWYSYHQLFAAILRNQLAKSGTERVSDLHRRASVWLEHEGLIEEAVEHALLGDDAERAADLLESGAPRILARGLAVRLLSYRSRIPRSLVEARPWLGVSFAWAALLSHEWSLLAAMLASVEAALVQDPSRLSPTSRANLRHIRGHTLCIQGYIAQARGDIARSIQLAEEADRELPQDNLLTRSANSINLAIDYLFVGDITRAVQHLEAARTAAAASGNNAVVLSAQAYLAETEMQRCRLDRAAEICDETVRLGARWGGSIPLPYTAIAFILLGQVLYERNDLEGAERNLAEGIRLAEANSNWTFLLKACLGMAKVLLAKGGPLEAIRQIRRAEDVAPRAPQARESDQLPAWRALLALRQGELALASEWAQQEETALPISHLPSYRQEFAYLTRARVMLARGEYRGLPACLDRVAAQAGGQGRTAVAMEALTLKALSLDGLAEPVLAQEALDRALTMGLPSGYVRAFVDEGVPMAQCLRRLIAAGRHADYAARLLAEISPTADRPAQPPRRETVAGLAEPFSGRELEVLRLIASGRSNKEIAHELVLAIGTVKKHTSNIFGKLGVESRTRAVARARDLGIL